MIEHVLFFKYRCWVPSGGREEADTEAKEREEEAWTRGSWSYIFFLNKDFLQEVLKKANHHTGTARNKNLVAYME